MPRGRKKKSYVSPKVTHHKFNHLVVNSLTYKSDYIKAFNQINEAYDTEFFAAQALKYLESLGSGYDFSTLPAHKLAMLGKLCYIEASGGSLEPYSLTKRNVIVQSLMAHILDQPVVTAVQVPKRTAQDTIHEKTLDLTAEIDVWLDTGEMPDSLPDFMEEHNFKSIHNNVLRDKYGKTLEEINIAIEGDDPEVTEAYSKMPRKNLFALRDMLEKILQDVEHVASEKATTRKPRAKKAIPADKLVSKLNYLEQDAEIGIKSVEPHRIVGADKLWIFNNKTWKLGVYVAKEGQKLSIKGCTVLNYDEAQSVCKNVRDKQLPVVKSVVDCGKVILRRVLEQIKAKEKPLNGRLNNDTILLRVVND